jgi:farnesyl-diphosphate farnesyltransferase
MGHHNTVGERRTDPEKDRRWEVCYDLLPKVSRTFALAILGLKEPLKGSVAVSYLLCRILDTVEDAPGLTAGQRGGIIVPFLDAMGGRCLPSASWMETTLDALRGRASADDFRLMENAPLVLQALYDCPATDYLAVIRWVTEMGRGMVETSGAMDRGGGLRTLASMAALDRYCYYIAGTVGYLLTDLFFLQSHAIGTDLYFQLQRDAEDFGLGLQKVNIIKDFSDDFRRGWCFVPTDGLAECGLRPEDLVDASKVEAIRLALDPLLRTAANHLIRGWRYLQNIPLSEREVRLFLAYSLFFAVRTLALAQEKPARLVAKEKLKISRLEVASIVASCQRNVDNPTALARKFRDLFEPLRPLVGSF